MKFNVLKITKILWLLILSAILSACSVLTITQEQAIIKLQQNVQSTLNHVNTKIADNPESALQNSISALDSILEYTETVKSDPSKFSPEKIQAYILKINIINENLERFSDLTLQTDISFPLGTYKFKHLSKKGTNKIDKLVDKIVLSIQEMTAKYPKKQIKIMVKTIGYTDETWILAGSRLEREILKTMPNRKIKGNPSQKRQQYNRILSQFRASTLNQYFVQNLQRQLPNTYTIEIMTEIVGAGEEFPHKKSTELPYRNKDSRRRICIISPFIEIIP